MALREVYPAFRGVAPGRGRIPRICIKRREEEKEEKMRSLTLSRRTFLKTSAVAAAAVGLSAGAESALAAAPYTAVDSAGEVKRIRTCCRGCGKMECGVWVKF